MSNAERGVCGFFTDIFYVVEQIKMVSQACSNLAQYFRNLIKNSQNEKTASPKLASYTLQMSSYCNANLSLTVSVGQAVVSQVSVTLHQNKASVLLRYPQRNIAS